MAQQSQAAGARPQDAARRQERADRMLDAVAALILRWGYNKTTIDDVARQAGVAKGTIYLHWNTREELFAALMQRERAALSSDVRRRIGADPASATLRGTFKHSALALMQRPLLKAMLLGNMEIIGKLARSEHSRAVYTERLIGFKTYLEYLREHNLVRSDLSLRAQVYLVGAVFTGFFLVAPLMPDDYALPDEEVADLLAETVQRALDPGGTSAQGVEQSVADACLRYLDRDSAASEEWLRQGS